MWEAAGARVSAAVAPHSAIAIIGDDPAATGAVALGIARLHTRTRRVYLLDLLGDGQGIVSREEAEALPGVSDMVHFGISLQRAARPHGSRANLWVVGGGAESPLTVDVLTDRWWEVIADQIRRAHALLLVAAPAMVPAMGQMVMHLDGVILVGEAITPNPAAALLAEVRSETALHTPINSPTVPQFAKRMAPPRRSPWRIPLLGALAVAVAAAVTFPRWSPMIGIGGASDVAALPPIPEPIAVPVVPATPAAGNEASYSVELLFTNSDHDAIDYVARRGDSLPAITFATVTVPSDTAPWFRLVAGAFPDSARADAFLTQLRGTGVVPTGAGSVARTPFALLLDSATTDAIAQLRVAAYRGRGIPAYALRDSGQVWHVYAGAFPTEGDARLLKQQLDSLNIQSALVMRAGSTP